MVDALQKAGVSAIRDRGFAHTGRPPPLPSRKGLVKACRAGGYRQPLKFLEVEAHLKIPFHKSLKPANLCVTRQMFFRAGTFVAQLSGNLCI